MLNAPRNDLYLLLKLSQRIYWSLLKDWETFDVDISVNEYMILNAMKELGSCTWRELFDYIGESGSMFEAFRHLQNKKLISKNGFNRRSKKGRWHLTARAEREYKTATVMVDQKALELRLMVNDQFFEDVLKLFNAYGQGHGTVHKSRSTDDRGPPV